MRSARLSGPQKGRPDLCFSLKSDGRRHTQMALPTQNVQPEISGRKRRTCPARDGHTSGERQAYGETSAKCVDAGRLNRGIVGIFSYRSSSTASMACEGRECFLVNTFRSSDFSNVTKLSSRAPSAFRISVKASLRCFAMNLYAPERLDGP